jgi:hypothetical protein
MSRLLASPRRRRRLLWILAVCAGLAPVVALLVFLQANNGSFSPAADDPQPEASPPPIAQPPAPAATSVRPVVVTARVRRQVDAVVERFVRTAVIRRNLDAGWKLASPVMREGVSRRDWTRGNLPVVPYPAKALKRSFWTLSYVDGRTLALDVTMVPKPGSGAPMLVYSAGLTAPGRDKPERWLVDYWYPEATLGMAEPAPAGSGGKQPAGAQPTGAKGRLGVAWLLVPAGLLGLIVLVPLVVVLWNAYARIRAERRYRPDASRRPGGS